MPLDAHCPPPELLRRSLDPDDPMTDDERHGIETHVDGCDRGCKQVIDAVLHDGPWVAPMLASPELLSRADPLPDRLGRYKIVGRIGGGGMGVVFRAHDPTLGRDVAVKVPHFQGLVEVRMESRRRFLREARAAAAVRHPHVCPIYDVGEDADQPYVVMALIEGESLAERLRSQGKFENQAEVADLVADIADALAAVHMAGVVHRDVKPGNILLDRVGLPFLTDFGLAHAEDGEHLTASGVLMGTAAYLAPEQVAPDLGEVGPLSDQYSLGVVLYQMLTGRVPFEGSAAALIYQIGSKPVPPPSRHRPDLDPRIDRVLLKAMAKRPEERYSAVEEFGEALRGCLQYATPFPVHTIAPPPSETHRSTGGSEFKGLLIAARFHTEKRTEEALRKSIATYYQILDKDPTFAPGWSGLASAYQLLSVRGHASPTTACPKGKSAALRAIALDNSLGEAHGVLATILMEYEWDLTGAEKAYRNALKLTPDNADTRRLYGKCLACLGCHPEAITELHRAVELNPLAAQFSTDLGRYGFLLARRYDEAVIQFRMVLQTDPDFWVAHRFLGWAYHFRGQAAESIAAFETARRQNDDHSISAGLGYVYGASGRKPEAYEILDELTRMTRHSYVSPDLPAIVCIGLGDKNLAFSWLAKVVQDRSDWLCKFLVDPVLDPLRSDLRFAELIRLVKVEGLADNAPSRSLPSDSANEGI